MKVTAAAVGWKLDTTIIIGIGAKPAVSPFEKVGLNETMGGIQVDGQFRTSIPGIFAVGDVAAFPLKAKSAKNKTSRSFQKDVHTLRSKTYARLAHELEMMDCRAQTRTDLYIKSRKRKNGEPVTEIAAKNIKEMEAFMSQQQVDPSEGVRGEIVYAEDDIYSQVISKEERKGRIRGLGFGPMISRTHSSQKSSYSDFVQQHMNDVTTIKTLQEQLLEKECQFQETMLEKEAERKLFEQKIEDMMLQKEKQFEERFKNLEQGFPGMHTNGIGRDEVSPGIQPRSSCASHHEENFAG